MYGQQYDEQLQKMMELKIDAEYLIKETGEKDLDSVRQLKIVVDTKHQSLYDISYNLHNLKSLTLDNSYIGDNIRDFGLDFNNLIYLSMNECQLCDIEGISCLSKLKELSLADNNIFDVTPLSQLEYIEVS